MPTFLSKNCLRDLDPKKILREVELALRVQIQPGTTLLFLDEVQFCPEAIVSLRYFKELMGNLHVIVAGSLLEFALVDKNISFPVGRVQSIYMRPHIIPIEVKAGPTGKLRSMNVFLEEKKSPFGIRICSSVPKKSCPIITLPFYLVSQLQRLCSGLSSP